jgi:hydrogenase expression/formation protein HypE
MTTEFVLLAHGAGGKLTAALIEEVFLPAYGNEILRRLGDGAVLSRLSGYPVLTTDSYVVRPIFFPGGDIGSLAVHGSVNDLLMCGAEPRALTVGFILEEGMPLDDLRRVCASIGAAARLAGVHVVTGDTKVVERGHGDKISINVTGLGERRLDCALGPQRVEHGDKIIINGPIGQHGIAVLAAREELGFRAAVRSDSRALVAEARALFSFGDAVKLMHDPTRGGLATCVNEIVRESGKRIVIAEESVPRDPAVEAACELLGFDSLYVANEGKLVAVVAADRAGEIVRALAEAGAPQPAIIGEVIAGDSIVVGRSALGGERLIDVLAGDPLPRIC